jgi:hypothetical protein
MSQLNVSDRTRVPRLSETLPPEDPTAGICLGTYGGLMGLGVSYERGTPVTGVRAAIRFGRQVRGKP